MALARRGIVIPPPGRSRAIAHPRDSASHGACGAHLLGSRREPPPVHATSGASRLGAVPAPLPGGCSRPQTGLASSRSSGGGLSARSSSASNGMGMRPGTGASRLAGVPLPHAPVTRERSAPAPAAVPRTHQYSAFPAATASRASPREVQAVRKEVNIHPDVEKFCQHFGIDARLTQQLDEELKIRISTRESDLESLWESLRTARNPGGLLNVKIREMQESKFIGKPRPDKHVLRLADKFNLDEPATQRLAEALAKRQDREKDLRQLEKHLENSNKPSALVMMMLSKLRRGEEIGDPAYRAARGSTGFSHSNLSRDGAVQHDGRDQGRIRHFNDVRSSRDQPRETRRESTRSHNHRSHERQRSRSRRGSRKRSRSRRRSRSRHRSRHRNEHRSRHHSRCSSRHCSCSVDRKQSSDDRRRSLGARSEDAHDEHGGLNVQADQERSTHDDENTGAFEDGVNCAETNHSQYEEHLQIGAEAQADHDRDHTLDPDAIRDRFADLIRASNGSHQWSDELGVGNSEDEPWSHHRDPMSQDDANFCGLDQWNSTGADESMQTDLDWHLGQVAGDGHCNSDDSHMQSLVDNDNFRMDPQLSAEAQDGQP